jgi:Ser/Thr protein kinase RdoA (MazF antagonist)
VTEAEEAARHWNGRVLRLVGQRENAVYEMETPRGRAALRLHRRGYQTASAIRSEHGLTRALAAAGVAVPAPLPAQGGDTLVVLRGGHHASATAWVAGVQLGAAGQPFDVPLPVVLARHRALGALVAQVHAATDAMVLPAGWTRPVWDGDGLAGETPVWGRFWEHPAATDADRAALLRARDALRERLRDPALGPLAPIHADVNRENVLVDGDRLSLIDFDDCGTGYRLYDLGTMLAQNLSEPAFPAIRDALMDGYGTADVAAVDLMTLARCCASVGWTMPRLGPDDPVHRRHIARAVMWAGRVVR